MPGPRIQEAEWQQCLDSDCALTPLPGSLVLSGSLAPGVPSGVYARLITRLRLLPVRILVDTSGDALQSAVLAGLYLIKPNLRELGQLVGGDLVDEVRQEAAATRLVREGRCEGVAVSLGAAGAMLVSANGCARLRSPTVPIQSKVGAEG
jgi:6-phosphofructokinase 2